MLWDLIISNGELSNKFKKADFHEQKRITE